MKRFLLLSLILTTVVLGSCAQNQPSAVPLADPYILLDGDTYYAYGTHHADGIEYYTSKDLVHWTSQGLALSKNNTTEQQWFWAPEVYPIGDHYVMYFSANEHLCVATSTSPCGPFEQVGGYMLQSLIGDEKCIDSHMFIDDDGSCYLFFVRFTDGNCIWMCELETDGITPKEETLRHCISVSAPWESQLGRVCEGPFVLKHNRIYYLTYSANDYRSHDYGIGYAQLRALSGTWSKYAGNPILQRKEGLFGTGHHSFFTDKEGQLRIVFHAHASETEVAPRGMYIGTAAFDGNVLTIGDAPIIRPVIGDDTVVESLRLEANLQPSFYNLLGQRIVTPFRGLAVMQHRKVLFP